MMDAISGRDANRKLVVVPLMNVKTIRYPTDTSVILGIVDCPPIQLFDPGYTEIGIAGMKVNYGMEGDK